MKATIILNLALALLITMSSLALHPQPSLAQDSSSYSADSEKYSHEELAQMLAPIALYPDTLLTQILMASTYPIEVVEADRWVKKNPALKGDTLDTALQDKDWSPSVQAMCHFPSILALMSERLTETTNLGNAFLSQEAEVMDTVQELRAKAHTQGNLTSNAQQKVVVEKETIIIQPADPRVIYVPYYDPLTIYGVWWYPGYPPYYWGPSGVSIRLGISYWPGIYFGFVFGTWSYFDWPHRYIYIDVRHRPRFIRHDRWITVPGRWHHDPRHRRGVAYYNKATAHRYGQYPSRARDSWHDTRGFPERTDRTRTRITPSTRIDERSRTTSPTRTEERSVAPLTTTPVETGRVPEQDRQRLERDSRKRSRIERDNQDSQIRERAERELKERARPVPVQQQRQKTEQVRQMPQGVQRQAQEPVRVETGRQQQQQIQIDRPIRQPSQQPRQVRPQQVERVQPQQQKIVPSQSRDSVFNRVDDGNIERRSSERGRSSRQGQSDADSRGRGSTNRGDREEWQNRGRGNKR